MTTGRLAATRAAAGRLPRAIDRRLAAWLAPGAILLLVLLAVRPLFAVGFPETHDGLNHLQRQVVFNSLFRAGILLPRWFPDFASGYGYPLGNFYPPLALYLAELPLLLSAGPTLALKLAFAASLALAGAGAYLVSRRVSGAEAGGVLGAAAYLCAPYLLVNVFDRGALPEALALGLLPWALWATDRWTGGRSGLPLLSILLAGLLLAHTFVAAVGWLLCALWWAANRRGPLLRLPLPFLGAAGLTAFFWLPAALEAGAVSLDNFARLGSAADNAVPLSQLVGFVPLYVYSSLPYRLGLVQVLGALGGLAVAWRSTDGRRPALVAFLLFAGCALAASSLFAVVWSLPALQAVQFPWRLLGPASLFGALAISFLGRGSFGPAIALGGAALLAVSGLSGISPTDRAVEDRFLSIGSAARREWSEGTIGTTTAAEYLPSVGRAAFAPGPLPPGVATDDPPLEMAHLNSFDVYGWSMTTMASEPTVVSAHQFAFPGWSAWLDGGSVDVKPHGPLGLASVDVPAGEHVVELRYRSTPARIIGGLISAATAVALAALLGLPVAVGAALVMAVLAASALLFPRPQASTLAAADLGPLRLAGGSADMQADGRVQASLYWLGRRAGGEPVTVRLRAPDGATIAESTGYPIWNTATRWSANEVIRDVRAMLPAPGPAQRASLEIEAGGIAQRIGEVSLPSRAAPVVQPIANRTSDAFGGRIRLDGWEVAGIGPRRAIQPGEVLDLTLAWSALRSVDEDYTVFVHLIGPDGRRAGQSDGQPAAGLAATTLWQPGEQVLDRRRIAVPPDAPPGRYVIEVGIYLLKTGQRLLAEGGVPVSLGPFKVASRPTQLPDVPARSDRLGPIELVGAGMLDGSLVLLWRSVDAPPADYTVFVHLLDASGRLLAQVDGPPAGGGYPTSLWSPGETIVDRRPLPAAGAAIALGLYDPATGGRLSGPGGDTVVIPFR